jgi:DNA-binding SARP family transcriptional activator
VAWLDLNGDTPDFREVLAKVIAALAKAGEGPRLSCDSDDRDTADLLHALGRLVRGSAAQGFPWLVVLDDLGDPKGQLTSDVCAAARTSGMSGLHFLITTRSAASMAVATEAGAIVVDARQLRLTSEEAALISGPMGLGSEEVERCRQGADGQAATFALLACSPADSCARPLNADAARILVRRLLERGLAVQDIARLTWLALLKSMATEALPAACRMDAERALRAAADCIPLVAYEAAAGHVLRFRIHDLVESALLDRIEMLDLLDDDWSVERAIRTLDDSGDKRRAFGMARRLLPAPAQLDWLEGHSTLARDTDLHAEVCMVMEQFDLEVMVGRPRVLLMWSESLRETGSLDEACAKARAALSLAEHEGDRELALRARLCLLAAMKRGSRFAEAEVLAGEIVGAVRSVGAAGIRQHALVECGGFYVTVGRISEALECAEMATRCIGGNQLPDEPLLLSLWSLLPALAVGDYRVAYSRAGCDVHSRVDWLSDKVPLLTNCCIALLETGRPGQVLSLLEGADVGLPEYYRTAVLCVRGIAASAIGESGGSDIWLEGWRLACSLGLQSEIAVGWVYRAVVLRSSGLLDDALRSAELGSEALSRTDYFGFRNLATIEVAASLLSLGDSSAARRWIATIEGHEGMRRNRYHALRASMVLAECDRLEGDFAAGVTRLQPHAEHIVSESSNWQMAMYIRAFPHLLGMLALAVGVQELPVHMLRMVLPEYAERCLQESRDELDSATWERLGRRVLGDVEFEQLAHRGGKPVCRVRLFGSLDVTIGDRRITERDWAKRKSRLMFAMLVIARGHDVPRDQILEYLWPEMDEDRARSNFYVVWSKMKLALGTDDDSSVSPFVESTRGRCRIKTEAVRSDVDEFEEALHEARTAESAVDIASAIAAYQRAAAVYRGDLLPGDIYDDWFSATRDRLRNDCVDGLLRLCDLLCDAGDPDDAAIFARKAVQVDPLREDAFQILLRCQIDAGQRSGAIDTFFRCKHTLSEELGLDPSSDTLALYERVLAMEERAAFSMFDLAAEHSGLV